MSNSETMSSSDETPESIADLERAIEDLDQAEQRVEEFGKQDLEELAEAYEDFTTLLDRYEEQVVGDAGDYQTNIEFQSEIADVVDDFPSGLLLAETFQECSEHLKQRYFKTSHFEHVREQLEPVEDIVQRLYDYKEALRTYRDRRKAVVYRIRELDDRIAELERLSRLGNADLDAPTEQLREPIEEYNEAVTDAFEQFHAEASAREVIRFLDAMNQYPLVEFEPAPPELREYLLSEPPGTEQISTLLEYSDYSRSKLDHYVEDPDRLKHIVGGKRTFLSGLSGAPLRIEWPPPAAEALQLRCEELTAAVNRVDPAVVADLRTVAALPRTTDYKILRTSAQAREDLTAEEREEIKSGSIDPELERAREERERLAEELSGFPEL